MRMCTVATAASNCSETVSLLLTILRSSKGVSMETVETPLDPPLEVAANYQKWACIHQISHNSTIN